MARSPPGWSSHHDWRTSMQIVALIVAQS